MKRTNSLEKGDKIEVLNGIYAVALGNPRYPELLREIYRPPTLLYYRGTLPKCGVYISIIGSRKPNSYGIKAVEAIVSKLVGTDTCIVSGLAYGVDTYAHIYALKYGLKTVAVLGSGVDDESIYPKSNIPLAHKIIRSGAAVVSQFSPGTKAAKYAFPKRNFLISGLSHSIIVVQGSERSGTLSTARAALEQNREVYAVPGSIFDPLSFAPNSLIQQGAKPLLNPSDFLNDISVFL